MTPRDVHREMEALRKKAEAIKKTTKDARRMHLIVVARKVEKEMENVYDLRTIEEIIKRS